MLRLIELHNMISDEYLTNYIEPRAKILHGLATAVPSRSSLDINLKLFDILGRIGTRGLWQLHLVHSLRSAGSLDEAAVVQEALQGTAELLVQVIHNNPVLCSPIKDSQAIDINIACLLLYKAGFAQVIQNWIQQTARATIFAYSTSGSIRACSTIIAI